MKVNSIEINYLHAGGLCNITDTVPHKKVMPYLSVVQAEYGSYDIEIDNSGRFSTGELGVFVAPSGKLQHIVHHNGSDGYMKASWVFIDATINHTYPIDNVYRFPIILPCQYNQRILSLTKTILESDMICRKYAAAYSILEILLDNSIEVPNPELPMLQIKRYVLKHFCEKINAEQLAKSLHCSIAQIFRFTKKYFNMSPANYINYVRLTNTIKMLEHSELTIKEIALSSGFDDLSYFSKLFKKNFLVSPSEYKKRILSQQISDKINL